MATMKAARIHQWGSSLQIDEIPAPEPQADEIVIRVRAAGVNPVDWKAAAGYMSSFPLPMTLGFDAAGDVVAVGSDIAESDLGIGDAVYAKPTGNGFAQFLAVKSSQAALKPRSMDYLQAASVPSGAITSWQALFDHGNLEAGQRVLIHGGAGGTGSFGVQLAKWKGAYVIATGSETSRDFVVSLGADEFIDYNATRFEDIVQDADVVYDTVGGETLERSVAAARPGGIIVAIAGAPPKAAAEARGVRTAVFSATPNRARFDEITRLIEEGFLKTYISAVYPLENVQKALDDIKSGHTRGKIVIELP